MAWKDLSIAQRSQLMNLYRRNGITSLSEMRQNYDLFSLPSQEESPMIGRPMAPIYAGGGNKFDGESEPSQRKNYNGQAVTLEAYKEIQRQAIRDAAIRKAVTRTEGIAPIINGKPGQSCIYTATDNYGRKYRVAGNQTFAANPEKYGFIVNGPVENARPGDLYQLINEKGVPDHMNMITGNDDKKGLLVSYSSGYAGFPNMNRGDYKVNVPLWNKSGYETYRFVGTPADNARWSQEWESLQGYPRISPIDTLSTGITLFSNGGNKFWPGGGKAVSPLQVIAAARKWYQDEENKKKLAYKLGAAAKQGAGLWPHQIVRAALDPQEPEYDELESYLYGPEKHYTPYKGTSRGPLTEEKYKGIPQYNAELNPRGEYVVPQHLKPAIEAAAKKNANIYVNADDLFDPGSVRYDAANHPIRLRYQNGRIVADAADLYDFDEGYADRYSGKNPIKKALINAEVKAMSKLGTPYIVRQEGIPVRFEKTSDDYEEARNFETGLYRGESGEPTGWRPTMQELHDRIGVPLPEEFANGGKIHIKKKNRGKFTALKKRTGHSTAWFKAHGTPAQKKMAVFAQNAAKWQREYGGIKF